MNNEKFINESETVKEIVGLMPTQEQAKGKELIKRLMTEFVNDRFKRKKEEKVLTDEEKEIINLINTSQITTKEAMKKLNVSRTTLHRLKKIYFKSQGIETKICSICGLEKPLSEYTVNSYNKNTGKAYLKSECNKCRKEHRTDQ